MIFKRTAGKTLVLLMLALTLFSSCKKNDEVKSSSALNASKETFGSPEASENATSETDSISSTLESGGNSMQQGVNTSKAQSNNSSLKSSTVRASSSASAVPEIPISQLKPDSARLAAAKQMISSTASTYGVTEKMLDDSVVSKGNGVRIANAMRKAMRGQAIRIGVLGGSVTEGFSATTESARYANQVLKWWTTIFPGVEVTLVNAGKGSTNSVIGAHRIKEDLLDKKVDFVIVEFAVNDRSTEQFFQATYESTVRGLLEDPSGVGVMLVFLSTRDGVSAQGMQEPVGKHYDLPMLSYKKAFGEASFWSALTNDGIHPKNNGHACIGLMVNQYLTDVYESILTYGASAPAVPSKPFNSRGKDYLKGKIVDPGNIMSETGFELVSMGGFQFSTKKITIASRSFSGVTASAGRETAPFVVKLTNCRNLFILMRRFPQGAKVSVQVDGQPPVTVESYSDAEHAWASDEIFRSETPKNITVKITPVPGSGSEFHVLGFLVS